MPKITCNCGEHINLSGIPSIHQYLFISDTDFDQYHDTIDVEDVYAKMKLCVQCPSCLRLHIYFDGFEKEPLIYTVEKNPLQSH